VTTLTATVTNNKTITDASAVTLTQAVADETSARASAVTALNSSISLKPNTIRATSAPTITQIIVDGSGNITTAQDPAMGSLWIDISTTAVTDSSGVVTQEPKNEMYVLAGAAGSAAWLKTQDASLLNVITSAATATSSLSTLTTADIAKAEQLTELEAQFTVESDGTISGVNPSKTIAAATNTARNTAIATANKASATRENNLTANVQKVFNQNSAPSVTLATQMTANVNSAITDSVDLVIDGQSSGTIVEGMVITGSGISGDVVVITVTNQNTLVLSSPQTLANNAVLTFNKAQSPPVNSLWYNTTNVNKTVKDPETGVDTTTSVPGNILHVLTATGSSPYYSWVENPDALLATQASVNTTASATADINGKLSSRYGVKVTAGGVFAGMELMARSDNLDPTGAGSISDIIFTSTNFKIKTLDSNGNVSPVAPFTVSGTTVSINGNLEIGGTPMSTLKTNAATGASALQPGNAANDVNSNTTSISGGKIRTGVIESTGYAYTSGNFSTAGAQINLDNGLIRSKNFLVDTSGNVFISGNALIGATAASTVESNANNATTATAAAEAARTATKNAGAIGPVSITGTSLYQGGGTHGSSGTGFYFDSNGKFSLRNNFVVDASGNVSMTGDINAISGNFTGTITSSSGEIGGWDIGNSTIESADDKVILDSTNNNITFINESTNDIDVIIGNTSNLGSIVAGNAPVFNPSTITTTTSATQVSQTGVTFVNMQQGAGQANEIKHSSGVYVVGNSAVSGRTVTATITMDESTYIAKVVTNRVLGSSGGQWYAEVGLHYSSYSGSGYTSFTSIGGTIGGGGLSASTHYLTLSSLVKTITLVMASGYGITIRPVVRNVKIQGALSSTGNVTLDYKTPTITASSITYSIGRTEIVGGGLQVVKDQNASFRVDRGSNNAASPFIESKGFMEHQGQLTVLNSSGTAGSGDIYIGGESTNNGGYLRIFSNPNSHKYIDWYSNTGYSAHNLIIRHNGNTKVTITDGGSLTATGGVSSDIRLKENIEYVELDATSVINQLKPATFKYIDFPEKTRTGFIAQDVLKILPNLVLGNGEEEHGTYGLDYDGILAIVVKGFKEQQSLIESQKTLIDNLTERVTTLEG
jgi:hypothetical protein